PLLHIAAAQQRLRRTVAQLQPRRRVGAFVGGPEEGFRRLLGAAGVGQRVAQRPQDGAPLRRRERAGVKSHAVVLGGAVVVEALDGMIGGAPRMFGRALLVAGAQPVVGELLVAGLGPLLERLRQRLVMGLAGPLGERLLHRDADAVV